MLRLLTLLSIVMLTGLPCAPQTEKRAAIRAVDEFHGQYNSHLFSSIYSQAHPDLKNLLPQDDFIEAMGPMRRGLRHTPRVAILPA